MRLLVLLRRWWTRGSVVIVVTRFMLYGNAMGCFSGSSDRSQGGVELGDVLDTAAGRHHGLHQFGILRERVVDVDRDLGSLTH